MHDDLDANVFSIVVILTLLFLLCRLWTALSLVPPFNVVRRLHLYPMKHIHYSSEERSFSEYRPVSHRKLVAHDGVR